MFDDAQAFCRNAGYRPELVERALALQQRAEVRPQSPLP